MRKFGGIIVVAATAFVLPAYAADRAKQGVAPGVAPQAITDPLKVIYRVSGVRDNGQGPNLGVATSFHCTNWSNVPEKLFINVFNFDGQFVRASNSTVDSRQTFTISTHRTDIFDEDVILAPGVAINQGSTQIVSTTTNIYCSAMIVDAASFSPVGISLHLVRFNPFPGSSE